VTERHRLGDLQLAIMRELWDRGEATVAQVHQALLPSRGLALTTIATMLSKMEQKGVVNHRQEGRQYVYRPTVAEEDVNRSMVGDLIDRLFAGDAAALVTHLIAEQEIDPDELTEIRRMIDAHERSMREGGRDA
jgi:predicted transcriptional regulator